MRAKRTNFLGLLILAPWLVMAEPLMYVPTGNANTIVIIDLKSDKITGHIGELENAHGLAAGPNSEYLVAGSMQPVEAGESRLIARPEAVTEAEHAAHHAGGGDMLTSPSYVSIVHPVHGHVMRRIDVPALTHHTAVSPDGKFAIAVHSGAAGISVIDLSSMKVAYSVETGQWPNYAVFSHDGRRLYVSNAQSGTISEIETGGWKVLRNIKVGKGSEHMVLSTDNSTLYVANVDEASAVAVNLAHGDIEHRYDTGAEPHGIDVSEDGKWLFVSSKQDGKLSRISLNNGETVELALQPAPYHLEYVDMVGKLYVSSRKEPKIWVIDPHALRVLAEINLGHGVAHQMVIVD